MAVSGHAKVVCSSEDIVLNHICHVLHVVSNPPIIFDKRCCSLGLDLGYSFEQLLMIRVVQVDFLSGCIYDDPTFLE